MISLGAFFGPEFDQNGDLGNLTVLCRALEFENQSVRVEPDVRTREILIEVDFLLVGDASLAHQRARRAEFDSLGELITERRRHAKWTLLVGSSYRNLAETVFGSVGLTRSTRISGFFSANLAGGSYWGYVNTDVELPAISIQDSVIGTDFFGPFLARNPSMIESICGVLTRSAWNSLIL